MIQEAPLRIAPGQTRPLNFNLRREGNSSTLRLSVEYSMGTTTTVYCSELISYKLGRLSMYDPQKVTFMHQGNTVSYAILRPPCLTISQTRNDESLPIMINLHGAGVEADSEEIRTAFDAVPDLRSWLLSPSGVTSWCGDDWRKFLNCSIHRYITRFTAFKIDS